MENNFVRILQEFLIHFRCFHIVLYIEKEDLFYRLRMNLFEEDNLLINLNKEMNCLVR